MSAPHIGQFIDLLVSIPAKDYENSFSCVMSEWAKQQGQPLQLCKVRKCDYFLVKCLVSVRLTWTKRKHRSSAGEIQGAYQIKVTTTALALLLSTRHSEMAKINVHGYLVKVWHILLNRIFLWSKHLFESLLCFS